MVKVIIYLLINKNVFRLVFHDLPRFEHILCSKLLLIINLISLL